MRIAIIGGIGSGKSEVIAVAREMGVMCVSADEINVELLNDRDYIAKIAAAFPGVVKGGIVDKSKLSLEVFSDKEKRETLNSIAHPEILKRILAVTASTVVVELPLVLESGARDYFDEIALVITPLVTRLARLRKTRNMSYRKAISIMRSQVSISALKEIATYKIDNSGNLANLKYQARIFFEAFCK